MPNRFFNNLYIYAAPQTIADIRRFVTSSNTLAAESAVRIDEAKSNPNRLVIRYGTRFVEFESVESLAEKFSLAQIVFHVYDGNNPFER